MSLFNNQSRKTTVIATLKVVVVMLIVYMIYRTVDKTGGEFTSRDLNLSNFSYLWLVASAFCYALGLSCFAWFWHGALRLLQQTPRLSESFGSYFISQLGKYVPGKALVVVIRSERVKSTRTSLSSAVTGVFIETLGMMAVGAVTAGLILAFNHRTLQNPTLLWISLGLAFAAGVPASPPLFRKAIRVVDKRKKLGNLEDQISHLTLRNIFPFWIVCVGGWLWLGVSMLAILEAFPERVFTQPFDASIAPLAISCVALAMVAGFISLIPGGAGVREYIILALLGPTLGATGAILAAVALRLVWLVTEVLLAIGSIIVMRQQRTIRNT